MPATVWATRALHRLAFAGLLGITPLAASLAPVAPAEAAQITLNASAMGRYDSSGAGFVPGFATDSRAFSSGSRFLDNSAFAVFNLPDFQGTVTSAVLRLTLGSLAFGFGSSSPLDTFSIETAISDLLIGRFAGNAQGQVIYNDLNSGAFLTRGEVLRNQANTVVDFAVTDIGLGLINAAEGRRFGFGFGSTTLNDGDFIPFTGAQLLVNDAVAVIEPASIALFGAGLMLLGAASRRRVSQA